MHPETKYLQMSVTDFGKKVVASHKISLGECGIVEITDEMWAVVAFDSDGNLTMSRNFAFTPPLKSTVWENCRTFYKKVKNCMVHRKLEDLASLEDE